MSVESAASAILQRGVQLDSKKRFTESLICYQEGMQLLVDMMKVELDMTKKNYLRSKIEGYMKRAEMIKKHIGDQKDSGIFHEQLQIETNSTGHSYKSLFGRFLDEDVVTVHVEDPYIRSFHQCQNFLRLCELLVKSCDNLKRVSLVTSYEINNGRNDNAKSAEQTEWFRQLAIDLKKRNVEFHVEFSTTLHDRQIQLSSGWIIKIGRGLDIYKPPENKFTLGMYDFDFRPCHETQLDIFHSKDVKTITS